MVVSGLIRPPPEIRAVANRTAEYVAKNGRTFEARILNSSKGQTPKFAFLHDHAPFHAYYQDRVVFYQNGGKNEEEEKETKEGEKTNNNNEDGGPPQPPSSQPDATASTTRHTTTTASAIDPVSRTLLQQRAKVSAARASDKNTLEPPPPLKLLQLIPPASASALQLEIIQTTAQFCVLHPRFLDALTRKEWNNPNFGFVHPRHGHFAYFSALVDAYKAIDQRRSSQHFLDLQQHALERVCYRSEYDRDKQTRQEQDKSLQIAQIDWHDFVVVETIDFAVDEVVTTVNAPPPPPPPQEETFQDADETIRVVPSYTPKVVSSQVPAMETVIDPITGKSVPIKDMPEHMRIQLLDPKWAQERKTFQDKQKESNLVSGDAMSTHLEKFAQARGDTFGKKAQDLLSSQADSKKRLEDANRLLRETGQGTVGPMLPGAATTTTTRKEPPANTTSTSEEPQAKKPKVTYATIPAAAAAYAASMEDPFATAATAAVAQPAFASQATTELLSEADFAKSLSKPQVHLMVSIPNDATNMAYNFYGQIVSISCNVMDSVKTVKALLSEQHLNKLPPNKIQLKNPTTGTFLKDNHSLAALNIGPTASLELKLRTRKGRK